MLLFNINAQRLQAVYWSIKQVTILNFHRFTVSICITDFLMRENINKTNNNNKIRLTEINIYYK